MNSPRFGDPRLKALAAIATLLIALWLFRSDLRGLAAVLWPLVAAGALFGFRAELNALLARLRRVSVSGAEFSETMIAAQITTIPIDEALKAVAPNEVQPAYIRQRVEVLRPELNAREPNDHSRREHLLMLRLVEAQQERDFLVCWLNIFATQHDALVAMGNATHGVDLAPYYDAHLQRRSAFELTAAPPATFELWAGYLARMRLAHISGKEGVITDEGRDFLTYIAARNLPKFSTL